MYVCRVCLAGYLSVTNYRKIKETRLKKQKNKKKKKKKKKTQVIFSEKLMSVYLFVPSVLGLLLPYSA